MLTRLLIKNYVLIEHLEIEPSANLNIITGETGAGKSIMLGALGLLLGKRADTNVLSDLENKCVVEGEFDVSKHNLKSIFEENELDFEARCVIRREISPSGKSRAFINDTPVNLPVLKNIVGKLIDIHSQHDTLLLESDDFQRQLIDIYAQNQDVLTTYKENYKAYQKADIQYKRLQAEAATNIKEFDYQSFMLEELNKADLDSLDQEALEEQLRIWENAENIKESLNVALEQVSRSEYSIENALRSAVSTLKPLQSFGETYKSLFERINSALIEMQDLGRELEKEEENVFFDPEEYTQIQDRLNTLYHLQKKHQLNTVAELIGLRESLQKKIDTVLNYDVDLERLKQEKEIFLQKTLQTAQTLTESRKAVFQKIEQHLEELLSFVSMPDARFRIFWEQTQPETEGCDHIAFLFTANKGIAPQALKNAASGGEFSRLMLCIKYILAGRTALPSIIFDEIDTGISGEVAIKVSRLLSEMAKNHQLVVISHLPQTAANGNCHYFVYKDNQSARSVSRIKKLGETERINEIAEMIGGKNPSPKAFESAKELLEMY